MYCMYMAPPLYGVPPAISTIIVDSSATQHFRRAHKNKAIKYS